MSVRYLDRNGRTIGTLVASLPLATPLEPLEWARQCAPRGTWRMVLDVDVTQ
jgi:hypothetical protein